MHEPPVDLATALGQIAPEVSWPNGMRRRGVVRRIGDGVAIVAGLNEVAYEELLQFDSGALGMAYDLAESATGVVLLSQADLVHEGDGVIGLCQLPNLAVGEELLGRMVNPLGLPIDEGPAIKCDERFPLFRPAPEITERKSVDQSLATGVLAIDGAIPIGRGQRELVIGDRNTGKTALALDFVAAQNKGDVACVYVVIGQPISRALTIKRNLQTIGCLENTAIVVADASSSPGMQYLAPYAGASVAEWFRDQGRDALVIYDDLTKHADAYRELALLLDRPPGREAFPGDIFHVHAELLERAAVRNETSGGGSVTAFPLVETSDGDISSYIPTNLISITDGQIYLDAGRFERNLRPAIDIGRSVSRIGGIAQSPLMRAAAKNLRITISRFEALESLTRVGLDMDVQMQSAVQRGLLLRELLKQPRLARRDLLEQVVALTAVNEDWLQGISPEQAVPLVVRLVQRVRSELPELAAQLVAGEIPPHNWHSTVAAFVKQIKPLYAEQSS